LRGPTNLGDKGEIGPERLAAGEPIDGLLQAPTALPTFQVFETSNGAHEERSFLEP
jgi:hypothetical protein